MNLKSAKYLEKNIFETHICLYTYMNVSSDIQMRVKVHMRNLTL